MARAPLDPTSPEAKGSALAAGLAFFQIALVGYLGYELYHVWRNFAGLTGQNSMASLILQVLFPAWLGVWLYLPTDPLTRATAKIGAVAGSVALVSITGLVWGMSKQTPLFSVWMWVVAHAIAFLAAFGVSEAIRPHLRGFAQLLLTPALRRSLVYLMLSAGAVGAISVFPGGIRVVEWDAMIFEMATRATFAGCAFAALVPLIISVLARHQKMGFGPLFQTPLGILLAMTMLAFGSQSRSASPALQALMVFFAIIIGAIMVKNWLKERANGPSEPSVSN
ncbi:hypothetical protein CVU37_04155 [candidate division BRC1 bacterium HGW-BRC1-1]|jgi:hypothetical protein|nr:MAG: hypothetical protein CVU37_04155 [candidate division BRC1 bacterium HGW-BRC1-1]